MPDNKITVTLIPLGGKRKKVTVPTGSNLDALLKQEGLSHKGNSFLVNSKAATGRTKLSDGAEVVVANKISGGR